MRRSVLSAALAACLAGAWSASAATIEVTTLAIETAPGECELDEAILSANDDFPVGGCEDGDGADTIVFAGGLEGAITLDAALPAIEETLTIRGPGADVLRIDGDQLHRAILVNAGVVFTLEAITIENGAAPAGNGGALLAQPGSDVTLRDCRITASEAANGGGVYVDEAALRVERCLLDGNTATAQGGGLHSRGSTVELVNTTVSGNTADEGGGIAVVDGGDPGTTSLYSVTLADNAADAGGNVLVTGGSEVEARHTVIAQAASGGNCDGSITSLDWNLSDDLVCGLDGDHDVAGAPPGLAALADNGGPTDSHALQAGSAAIDAGDTDCRDAQGVALETDQRGPGFPRPTDGDGLPGFECDIGAIEAAPEPAGAAAAAAAALAALARRRRHRLP